MITLAMIAALEMPPKQFDYPPRASFEVVEIAPNLIRAACRGAARELVLLGCWDGLRIFIRTDLTPKARAKVLRHEYGHVNGWVHG